MNKKLILTLGSISTVFPVAAVLSCGIDEPVSSEEQKLYRNLTSSVALRILENQWQYKVLEGSKFIANFDIATIDKNGKVDPTNTKSVVAINFDNAIVKKIAISMIQKNMDKSKEYLQSLALSLLKSGGHKSSDLIPGLHGTGTTEEKKNVYNKKILDDWGMMQNPWFSHDVKLDTTQAKNLNDKALKLLLSDDRLSFKNELLQNLVVYKYLTTVNRESWAKAFPTDNKEKIDKRYKDYLDPSQFILTREAFTRKYFGKWSFSLDKTKSDRFAIDTDISPKKVKANVALNNMMVSNDKTLLSGNTTYSERNTLMSKNLFDFTKIVPGINYEKIVSFDGIVTQAAGKDNLRFTADSLKLAKKNDYYQGFITPDKFIQLNDAKTKFPFVAGEKDKGVASLTFVTGIMPTFNAENKFAFDDAIKSDVAAFFAAYDSGLYTDAKNYYLTEAEGKKAIILEFKDTAPVNHYKAILEDKFNIDFLEAKDPK